MTYKLLALDMDGTVLAPDTTMTAATKEAINQALAAGVNVVFCSGRCTEEIRPFVEAFPEMRYAVCENGVYTLDMKTDSYVDFRGLDRWLSDRIMEEADKYDLLIQLGVNGRYYIQDGYLDRLDEFGLGKYYGLLSETGGFAPDLLDFYRKFEGTVSKINFYCRNLNDREEIVQSLLADNLPLNIVSGLADNIEMNSSEAGKGEGLKALCRYLQISSEQVIAIGDNYNDISMLEAAGLAVAMGNAVPEVKELADVVTEDNGHDGVAAAIRRFILSEDK